MSDVPWFAIAVICFGLAWLIGKIPPSKRK
ncbi:hypothetical protein SAMN04489740_2722 [Arthrobacter alpinus]|uniref:Uncharacterized protein n=1 Tax=Arthrobacter alpinus TaxID=656366 RepID=A0A1H5M2M8_9MICC|nr:hypothetical protein SAMN04489740_2722 [Arthrobacter alpinus]